MPRDRERPDRVVYLGLDYAGLRIAVEAIGMSLDKDLFAGLRTMEIAALAELNRAEGF